MWNKIKKLRLMDREAVNEKLKDARSQARRSDFARRAAEQEANSLREEKLNKFANSVWERAGSEISVALTRELEEVLKSVRSQMTVRTFENIDYRSVSKTVEIRVPEIRLAFKHIDDMQDYLRRPD